MNAITLIWRQVLKELKLFQMKENKEDADLLYFQKWIEELSEE